MTEDKLNRRQGRFWVLRELRMDRASIATDLAKLDEQILKAEAELRELELTE